MKEANGTSMALRTPLFFAVGFLLLLAHRTVASALVQHSIINPVYTALALQIVLGICLACENRTFITTNQLINVPLQNKKTCKSVASLLFLLGRQYLFSFFSGKIVR